MRCDVCGAPGVHPGRGRCGGTDVVACGLRATAEELRHDVLELRAERDALKAQVEAHARDLGSLRSAVHDALPLDYPDGLLIKQVSVMGAELVRLRRQVEAVRKWCRDQLDHGKVEADDLAERILDAMDEAAKTDKTTGCDCRLGCVNCNPWLW